MRRATSIAAAGSRTDDPIDSVILSSEARNAQRGTLVGVNGTQVELALSEPMRLRGGDLLVLEDGGAIDVVAEAEPLLEARAADLTALARLAWHLGDRHVQVQVMTNRLRLRQDAAIEALLRRLGAKVVAIEAPFDPEGGAYATAHHDHHRDHHHHDHAGHHHGHDHGHHDHHGHGHDHHHDHDHHDHHHGHDHAHQHDHAGSRSPKR